MSDFYNPHEYRKAIKQHRCTYCGEAINKGDQYTFQKGNYDGRWYESKMHDECFEDMCEEGDGEYTPYINERPQRAEVTPNTTQELRNQTLDPVHGCRHMQGRGAA